MIQPIPKSKRVIVIVWTNFWKKYKSNPYKLARDFKSKKIGYSANLYLEILENNIPGIW